MASTGARAAKAHKARLDIVECTRALANRLGVEVDIDGAMEQVCGYGEDRAANELDAVAGILRAIVEGNAAPAEATPDPEPEPEKQPEPAAKPRTIPDLDLDRTPRRRGRPRKDA